MTDKNVPFVWLERLIIPKIKDKPIKNINALISLKKYNICCIESNKNEINAIKKDKIGKKYEPSFLFYLRILFILCILLFNKSNFLNSNSASVIIPLFLVLIISQVF